MQKVARLSAPVRPEDVGYVDLPRVGRGLAGDHVVEVGEDLRLDLPAQAETQEEHTAGNRGCESCLSNLGLNFFQMLRTFFCKRHLELPGVRKKGGTNAFSARTEEHHGAAPHPVLAGQVHRLDFQLDRVGAGKLEHPRLFRQVHQWPSTRVLCVAVVLLHKIKVKRLIWKSGTLV